MNDLILNMKGIAKSFNGNEVLHSVNLSIHRGKVTALVGENGAGKSTLMKILMGEYQADKGKIYLDGEEVHFANSHQSLMHGVSMIFQEMSPFPELTVAENMFVGREPHQSILLNQKELKRNAQNILNKLHINLDINEKVKNLTVSQIQLLEIAKAVSHDAKIVIMDEPTSALTEAETELLFEIIETLKQRNVSIIYITHKLDELKRIADYICVLRDGNIISFREIESFNNERIISEMVGRKIEDIYPNVEKDIGNVIFEVKNFSSKGHFRNINFQLHAGEILGFAGIVGAGRTEIVESLFGILKHDCGEILIYGKNIEINCPKDAIKNHIALIPEDRARNGLNLLGTINENMTVTMLNAASRWKGILASSMLERQLTQRMIKELTIKSTGENQKVGSLSGGNQQKVVLAKWLLTVPNIIFFDEPTRGIDVGAKYQIYLLIQALAKEGKAVIMVSSEMSELLGICDRLLVLSEGKIVGELNAKKSTQEMIMSMILNTDTERMEKNEI